MIDLKFQQTSRDRKRNSVDCVHSRFNINKFEICFYAKKDLALNSPLTFPSLSVNKWFNENKMKITKKPSKTVLILTKKNILVNKM